MKWNWEFEFFKSGRVNGHVIEQVSEDEKGKKIQVAGPHPWNFRVRLVLGHEVAHVILNSGETLYRCRWDALQIIGITLFGRWVRGPEKFLRFLYWVIEFTCYFLGFTVGWLPWPMKIK